MFSPRPESASRYAFLKSRQSWFTPYSRSKTTASFSIPALTWWASDAPCWRNAGDDRLGQGGSTITQQLVKNTYLSPERTLRRKYAEAMLAFALERRLSKEDIFALYCNEVYLGQRGAVAVRGVEEAARVYFGKELKDLSLAEAATIAGMIQGPMRFSPTQHPEATQARRNVVLDAMARDGWINTDQATALSRDRSSCLLQSSPRIHSRLISSTM